MPGEACGDAAEAGERPCEGVVASRLREAYAALDCDSFNASGVQALSPHIPCASSLLEAFPSLRELCTVTLNLEVLLRCSEADSLCAAREKYLRWHRCILHTLGGVHDIDGFLRYWVKGVVAYEFREMQRHMDDDDGGGAQAQGSERGGVERAIEHAVELREALQRLPKLVAFLFSANSQQAGRRGGGDVINEEVRYILAEQTKQQVLRRLLMEVLQRRRAWNAGVPGSDVVVAVPPDRPAANAQLPAMQLMPRQQQQQQRRRRQLPTNSIVSIAELLQLQLQPTRGAERLLVTTVLQSVVRGCRSFFPREALLSLLRPDADAEARHAFLVKAWPRYWSSELAMTRELPGVEEASVKGLLTKLVFLWEPGDDAPAHEPLDTAAAGLQHCYVVHLLRVTLRRLVEQLFALDATAGAGAARGPLKLLLDVAQAMACVEAPPRGTPQLWEQAGPGVALPDELPREVGHVAMAAVLRALLQARLTAAVEHFLGGGGGGGVPAEQRGPRLLAYLLRTERVFHLILCKAPPLGARMHEGGGGGAVACFYGAVKHALVHPRRNRGADVFADTLLDSLQTYLLQGGRESGAVAAVSLQNEDEFLSAVRLTQCVAATDRYLRLYKELLAYRLLSYAVGRAREGGGGAAEARREKLQAERAVCEHLQKLLPLERDSVRQMLQMCLDVEAGAAAHDPRAPQEEPGEEPAVVRPTLWLLSRRAWPVYPVLADAPPPLRHAMHAFALAYHAEHSGRRVVWLRTSMETVSFTVAYPRATKLIVGSLELFNIFHCLGEAGAAGATWTLLAQRTGKEKPALQRGVRRLLSDGFFTLQAGAEEECLALNAAFTSPRTRYHFLQQPPRVVALAEAHGAGAGEARLSHSASIKAAIIKHMKRVRNCLYDELFLATQQQNPQFELKNSDFKLALETLIEKEFVARDPLQKQRFFYKA
ncbi:cullin-4B [Trypanosoma conorhini]|uniref:Cullin-4B n=1 Tax=Trypanosoma conorhini TaxID=83891 RepID=A0A422P0W6_9TRYP|nr:cullin-4B [Trypanosoma conorhini]RNF11370.1 cullin-4B [Trypanosoma conorhini]